MDTGTVLLTLLCSLALFSAWMCSQGNHKMRGEIAHIKAEMEVLRKWLSRTEERQKKSDIANEEELKKLRLKIEELNNSLQAIKLNRS